MKNWRAAFVACSSFFALALASSLSACAAGESQPAPAMELVAADAWTRAADSGSVTAVYFTIRNPSLTNDTLTGILSNEAATAVMHVSTQHGRNMLMSPVRSLPLPADDSVRFQPLGAHVMLTGLVRPLQAGDSVLVTLQFGSGRQLPVYAKVRNP